MPLPAGPVARRWRLAAALGGVFAGLLLIGAAHAEDPEGYRRETLSWGGRDREYLIHVPPSAGNKPLPLVLALHGAGGNAADFAQETRFALAADSRGMLVAVPDGTGTQPGRLSWNAHFCCGAAIAQQSDDIGFIGALIERLAKEQPVDRRRVYATGMSNGGMLSYQLAAAHPEWFAAIAPVSATIGGTNRQGEFFAISRPSQPVPVMIIHGRKDPYVLFDGGVSPFLTFTLRSNLAVADAIAFWTAADGCASPPQQTEPVPGKLRLLAYPACRDGSEVVLWEIEEGDHSWPNVSFPGPNGEMRSTAEEILAFFATHSSSLRFTTGSKRP